MLKMKLTFFFSIDIDNNFIIVFKIIQMIRMFGAKIVQSEKAKSVNFKTKMLKNI